jgi:dUTP pyrophosphatase
VLGVESKLVAITRLGCIDVLLTIDQDSMGALQSLFVAGYQRINAGPPFRCVLLNDDARVPSRGTTCSAGWDVYATVGVTVYPGTTIKVPLGIAIEAPHGTYGRTACRSGLAVRQQIFIAADVIDRDYTGEVHVCLTNVSSEPYLIKKHERIGCIVFERHAETWPKVVDSLPVTLRGGEGFGSTGRV